MNGVWSKINDFFDRAVRGSAKFWFCLLLLITGAVAAQDADSDFGSDPDSDTPPAVISTPSLTFFTLGTGSTSGTYFPIGGLIASALSQPQGPETCSLGGSCGVRGLIVTAQASNGSVENISNLRMGEIDAALTQADIAYWASQSTVLYEEEPPFENLRGLASLYTEMVHLVVMADSEIEEVTDLAGKSVYLGRPSAGSFWTGHLILEAYGLTADEDYELQLDLSYDNAAIALSEGRLDAMMIIGGVPMLVIEDLAQRYDVRILSFDNEIGHGLTRDSSFLVMEDIESEIYRNIENVTSLGVPALLVTTAEQPESLIYNIMRAFWHPQALNLLYSSHLQARAISLGHAREGMALPLHPGAQRFYEEIGISDELEETDSEALQNDADEPVAGEGEALFSDSAPVLEGQSSEGQSSSPEPSLPMQTEENEFSTPTPPALPILPN